MRAKKKKKKTPSPTKCFQLMMPLFQKRRTRRRLIYGPKVVKQPYPIEKCSDSNFLNQDDPYHVTRYSCVPKGTDKKCRLRDSKVARG